MYDYMMFTKTVMRHALWLTCTVLAFAIDKCIFALQLPEVQLCTEKTPTATASQGGASVCVIELDQSPGLSSRSEIEESH